jgi:hypothetical protein
MGPGQLSQESQDTGPFTNVSVMGILVREYALCVQTSSGARDAHQRKELEYMTNLGRTKRRQLLKGAGTLSALGALTALGKPAVAFANSTNAAQGPEGSWFFTVTASSSSGLPSPIVGLETYAAGGGYTETDQLSFMPSTLATPGHGSWKRTGERTFLLTYLTLNHDTAGTFQGTSKIRQVATLNDAGDAYSGSGNFDVYDVQGTILLSGTFTIHATRIRVEAP